MENKIAEVSLIYKTNVKASDRAQITNSKSAFESFFNSWNHDKIEHVEEFKVLLLNRANRVLGICKISTGGISGTVVDVKIVLQYALKSNASAIILGHNHPSGKMQPSNADINITKKIRDASQLLDINVLDHLIISPHEEYYSMSDHGDF